MDSLWRSTAAPAPETTALDCSKHTDVVIVGAGYVGLNAAIELAACGVRVCVLESGDIGWGASGRSGGQVNPIMRLQHTAIARRIGADAADRLIRATIGSADLVFDIIKRHQIACDAVQNGWLQVAHCDGAARSLQALAQDWERFGARIDTLDRDALRDLSGTAAYCMGLRHPTAGHVQPMSYVRGLARAALQAGAGVHTHSRVDRLQRSGSGQWRVCVGPHVVTADTVLICTNAYTQGLETALDRSYLPFTPIQLATQRLPPGIYDGLLRQNETIADTRRLIFYGRKTADKRLVFGGLGKGLTQMRDYERIKREALRIFPILRDVRWEYQWGGMIAMTVDSLPHIHEVKPGLFAALGCNGRGVAMSAVAGRAVARYALSADHAGDIPLTRVPRIVFQPLKARTAPHCLPMLSWLDRLDH